jgi:predicted nucleotidyltransferase
VSPIEQYRTAIQSLCAQHKVKTLYAFGSVLTGQFTVSSDIDFIVEFKPLDVSTYADNYYNLKFALEETFRRPIDLLEEQAIKNPYFRKRIESQRQLVYG